MAQAQGDNTMVGTGGTDVEAGVRVQDYDYSQAPDSMAEFQTDTAKVSRFRKRDILPACESLAKNSRVFLIAVLVLYLFVHSLLTKGLNAELLKNMARALSDVGVKIILPNGSNYSSSSTPLRDQD